MKTRIPLATVWRFSRCLVLSACFAPFLSGQELQPRAYVPTPVGLNYFGISYSNNVGGLLFDPSLPVTDARVDANAFTLAFGQTLGVFGRTAQALAVLPYLEAHLNGTVADAPQHQYRSGLGDATFRYAMNIYGAPAMSRKEFATFHEKTIVGASLTMTVPSGQYDPNKLLNIGTNRWGFKPEIGLTQAIGKWGLESAAGVWLHTANNGFAGNSVRTQIPLGSFQAHLVRNLPHRSWVAGDMTYFTGGRSQVDGRNNADYIASVRLGATLAVTLTPRQVIKISYFDGAIARIGADIRSIGISYNIIWLKGELNRRNRP
ncbi:MAG TPA: transporter [Bryobacteraceae bacterium]|nr:transporter [Bryobacteraceae bacterium]